MQVTVVGASGRTGRPLVSQALGRGHAVTAFLRDAANLDVDAAGAADRLTVVEGDAYAGDGVDEAVAGADAVLSVLGHGTDGPPDLLTVAGRQVTAAMAERGVDRYVTLVCAGVRVEGGAASLGGRAMGAALRVFARARYRDAVRHVRTVERSGLDWTVVRVPRLTDDPGTGEYEHGDLALGVRDVLPREDLADFLLRTVEEGAYVREYPLVVRREGAGQQTEPIATGVPT